MRFAGRIHGFLEGPGVGSGVSEVALADYRKKLFAGLTEKRKAAFLEGRDEVVDSYLGRKDDQDATREKVRRDQEQQRDERLTALDKEREQNERRAAELNSERTRLRSELTDQLADFQRQDRPLADQFNRLEVQAAPLRRELLFIDNDIARLEGLLVRERNPAIRDQIRRDISRLEASGNRLQGNLDVVQRQGAVLAAQRADLQRQAAQVQASIGRQLDGVEREQAGLQKRAKAADGEERRLRGANLGDSGQLRAMASQSSAFTTYVPYPVEEARQELLDRLR
jgi:chromosome segregation ATPase